MKHEFNQYFSYPEAGRQRKVILFLICFVTSGLFTFYSVHNLFLLYSAAALAVNATGALLSIIALLFLIVKKYDAARYYIFWVLTTYIAIGAVMLGIGEEISVYLILMAVVLIPFFMEDNKSRIVTMIFYFALYFFCRFSVYFYLPETVSPLKDTFRYANEFVIFAAFICGNILINKGMNAHIRYVNTQNEELQRTSRTLKEINKSQQYLFSVFAHDLRNSAGTLHSLSDYLYSGYDECPEEKKRAALKMILDTANSHKELVLNLLEWIGSQLRKRELKIERTNLHQIVRRATAPFSTQIEEKRLRIVNTVTGDIDVMADENALLVVVRNLVANAVKFSPAGGVITFSSELADSGVLFRVADEGEGIPEKAQERLFTADPAYPAERISKKSGTGLGLLICREFTERMGGTISVESGLHQGSRLTITLPST